MTELETVAGGGQVDRASKLGLRRATHPGNRLGSSLKPPPLIRRLAKTQMAWLCSAMHSVQEIKTAINGLSKEYFWILAE